MHSLFVWSPLTIGESTGVYIVSWQPGAIACHAQSLCLIPTHNRGIHWCLHCVLPTWCYGMPCTVSLSDPHWQLGNPLVYTLCPANLVLYNAMHSLFVWSPLTIGESTGVYIVSCPPGAMGCHVQSPCLILADNWGIHWCLHCVLPTWCYSMPCTVSLSDPHSQSENPLVSTLCPANLVLWDAMYNLFVRSPLTIGEFTDVYIVCCQPVDAMGSLFVWSLLTMPVWGTLQHTRV